MARTRDPVADWRSTGGEALELHAPEVATAFGRLTRLCPEPLPTAALLTPAFTAFLRRFRSTTARVDAPTLAALAAETGDLLPAAVQVVWIADTGPRVRAVLDALFSPTDWPVLAPLDLPDLSPEIDDFVHAVGRLRRLGPVVSELVRVRCAAAHGSRTALARRDREAALAGVDDGVLAALDHHADSDLPVPARRALALTDVVACAPYAVDPRLVSDVRRALTPAQAVEVVCDVARHSVEKMAVARGLDDPPPTPQWTTTRADGSTAVLGELARAARG